ncbi:cellulase family glycosylhydrolase [Tenacibaculum ovolyticum]|uniref:cellulase family glycosylhydrolase n=1 Tax=Tenacibaculum ovolyticum TaxID=104270 RepID=UPI003BA858C1
MKNSTYRKTFIKFILILSISFTSNAQNYCSSTPVEKHGDLSVSGNKIVDKNNKTVSFAGNSFFWSNTGWGGEKYYKVNTISWLKNDWNTTIIRAAMGVEDSGGYISNPTANKNRIKTIVNTAIAKGLYVVIDWHSHHAENHQQQAIDFFKEIAQLYGDKPNVIYEIYNEPLQVSWTNTIKPYAEAVISEIRKIDPDNLIVVGTPTWSQDVDVASNNPITSSINIAYALHFYAATHKESLQQKAKNALNNGIAIMVTEWGTVAANGNGSVDNTSTNKWMNFLSDNDITHLNWALNDKNEGASSLKPGTSINGNWNSSDLTASGTKVKNIIKNWKTYCDDGDGDGDNSGNKNITVKAKGIAGTEKINIIINGTIIKTISLTNNYVNYKVSGIGKVKVEFINDKNNRDVRIDYIKVDDLKYESENQIINTGVWQNSSCGGSNSEWLHCNGYIEFSTSGTGNNNTCGSIEAWSASSIYPNAGAKVSYNGKIYQNNWYTTNQNPETNSGQWQVWLLIGECEENPTQKVSIFPNPSQNSVKISIDINEYHNFKIFDLKGNLVLNKELKKSVSEIPLNNYKDGVYILKLYGKNMSVLSKKIIKKSN